MSDDKKGPDTPEPKAPDKKAEEPAFKLERGARVRYHFMRNGPTLESVDATVTKVWPKPKAGADRELVDLEFDWPGTQDKRNATEIPRGAGPSEPPCWTPL